MNVGVFVARAAAAFGDRTAVIDGERRLTFRHLDERTNRLANALIGLGIRRNDRVALALPNSIEWIEAEFAITKAGAMTAPIGMRTHPAEMARFIALAQANLLITDAPTLARLSPLLAPTRLPCIVVSPEGQATDALSYETVMSGGSSAPICVEVDEERDGRVMRFTSGTTGTPKGVYLTHRNWLSNAYGLLLDRHSLQRDDVVLTSASYAHAGGLWHLPALIRGAVIHISDRFDPEQTLRDVEGGRATVLKLVPTTIRRLLDVPGIRGRDLNGLRAIQYGGAPIEASTLGEAIDVFGPKLIQGYGLNEACMICTLSPEDHVKRAAQKDWKQPLGRETSLIELKLADRDGNPVVDGDVGEIAIRGRLVFREYWRDPAATAAAIRDGWFYTGDLAQRGEQGFLYLAGRSKDIIVTGGFNVAPAEVEAVLDQHPAVHQCAVAGLPHREWGEQVTAFVVTKPGSATTQDALLEFCSNRLTAYKKPKAIHFVPSLPLNTNGKVMRRELATTFADMLKAST
jgi:acyl-CoA synthetase (AMP-forming)/AMP-acid ligase II